MTDRNQQYYAGGYPAQQPAGYPQGGYVPAQTAGYPQGGYVPAPTAGYPQAAYDGAQQPIENFSPYEDSESAKNFSFDDQSIRRAFIRKVYMILMAQLLVTFGFIALFVFHEPTTRWVANHSWLLWVALAILLVTMISMACCEGVRRKTPMNFIFLFLFTIAESFLLGIIAGQYAKDEVLMAVGITAAVCLALTLFALQTKWDFTMCGGVLLVAMVVFVIFGIFAIFFHGKILSLVYASCGALLFSIYLVYDTQLMLGGKHKYSISPEEYIFAALNLYLDIVNIFMYILAIIGAAKS